MKKIKKTGKEKIALRKKNSKNQTIAFCSFLRVRAVNLENGNLEANLISKIIATGFSKKKLLESRI